MERVARALDATGRSGRREPAPRMGGVDDAGYAQIFNTDLWSYHQRFVDPRGPLPADDRADRGEVGRRRQLSRRRRRAGPGGGHRRLGALVRRPARRPGARADGPLVDRAARRRLPHRIFRAGAAARVRRRSGTRPDSPSWRSRRGRVARRRPARGLADRARRGRGGRGAGGHRAPGARFWLRPSPGGSTRVSGARIRAMRLTVALALLAAVLLAPSASATAPVATASKSCGIGDSRGYGTTYVLKISASGTSCRAARSLIRAYHACRPGKSGKCGQREGLFVLREALRQDQDAIQLERDLPQGRQDRQAHVYSSSPSGAVRLGRPVLLAALALAAAPAAAPAAQTVRAGPLTGTVADGVGVQVERAGAGVTAVHLTGPAGARTVSIGFPARRGERLTGFGERSNAVDQRGRDVLNYAADGPFLEARPDAGRASRPRTGPRSTAATPPTTRSPGCSRAAATACWSTTTRPAASSCAEASWRVEVDAGRLDLRVFAGPRPADALRRFTEATGRQPAAARALGLRALVPDRPAERDPARRGVAHLPHAARRGRARVGRRDPDALPARAARTAATRDYELERTRRLHAAGLAHLAYFNPHLCDRLPAGLRRGRGGRRAPARRGRPAVHLLRRSSAARARAGSASSRSPSSTSRRRPRGSSTRAC